MTCDEIRALYLDCDLDLPIVQAAVQIAEHLGECKPCRQAAGEYDQLRRLLKVSNEERPGDLEPAELFLPALAGPTSSPTKPDFRYSKTTWLIQAALVLLAMIGWGLYLANRQQNPPNLQLARPDSPAQPTQSNSPSPEAVATTAVVPASLHWTAADVERRAAMFSKVSESFDGRAGWVAVGDHASDVGLIDGPAVPPAKVFLVRLLMSQGDRPPSTTDLVIVPGQSVSVELPFQSGEVLRYRLKTKPGPKPQLTLGAEIRSVAQDETLAALATRLEPQPGEALSAARISSQSGPYKLEVSFSETALSAIQQ